MTITLEFVAKELDSITQDLLKTVEKDIDSKDAFFKRIKARVADPRHVSGDVRELRTKLLLLNDDMIKLEALENIKVPKEFYQRRLQIMKLLELYDLNSLYPFEQEDKLFPINDKANLSFEYWLDQLSVSSSTQATTPDGQ